MWEKGSFKIGNQHFYYCAKVYDEGSIFGIDEGRISKLTIKKNDKVIVNYDRGWDIEPKTEEAKEALDILLKKYK